MLLKVYKVKYEKMWKASNPNDNIFIQMLLVQINNFVLIKMDILSLHSPGIPVAQSRDCFLVTVMSNLEQTV